MAGDESDAGPRSLSTDPGSGFARVPGRRRSENDAGSRSAGGSAADDRPLAREDGTREPASGPTAAGRAVLYAAVAAAVLATGADGVATAAASVDLPAPTGGPPWLLAGFDAALTDAAAAASRAALLARAAAGAVLAWVGVRVAVRCRA